MPDSKTVVNMERHRACIWSKDFRDDQFQRIPEVSTRDIGDFDQIVQLNMRA